MIPGYVPQHPPPPVKRKKKKVMTLLCTENFKTETLSHYVFGNINLLLETSRETQMTNLWADTGPARRTRTGAILPLPRAKTHAGPTQRCTPSPPHSGTRPGALCVPGVFNVSPEAWGPALLS